MEYSASIMSAAFWYLETRTTAEYLVEGLTKEEIMDPSKVTAESKAGIINRPMTWCDLFYIAAVDITEDRYTLITRYPIDSCYNQFPIGINVNSTIKTEPLIVDGKFYRWYPYIREEDIGKNTTSTFVDTCMLPDTALEFIRGDYRLELR